MTSLINADVPAFQMNTLYFKLCITEHMRFDKKFVSLLQKLYFLPNLLFGGVAVVTSFMLCLLPETRGVDMPQTVAESEQHRCRSGVHDRKNYLEKSNVNDDAAIQTSEKLLEIQAEEKV